MEPANRVLELAAQIVAAYVGNNSVPQDGLPKLISEVYSSLRSAGEAGGAKPAGEAKPPVNIRKTVTSDYIICLEDGKKFKSLKRHLRTHYNMSPEQYREKWHLPADYPMVAPKYAEARSRLAKRMGLGRHRKSA